jgi:hypothetical protein
MRALIIVLVVVGVVFVAMMIFGPGQGPSPAGNRSARAEIESSGPPPILSAIGSLTGRFAPKANLRFSNECPEADRFAERGNGYRLVTAHLVSGAGAAIFYTRKGTPERDEEVPTILCLRAEGAAPAIQVDCGNERIEAEGTLAIGSEGGCIAVLPLGVGVPPGTVTFNCPSDRDDPADCPY